ncbi:MAG: response regulator [Myxococcales bacterium]|nr:MAG: response regulator [Myxococcales bacterium]
MSASIEAILGERPRVLVVDDDVILRRVVRSALAQAGFDVAQVGSGRDALRLASAYDLDLIVTDLQMPGMSGLELLYALQEQRTYCPVIVMSGSTEARPDAILAAGAAAFLAKPFGLDELQQAARTAVERARTLAPPSSAVLLRRVGNVA